MNVQTINPLSAEIQVSQTRLRPVFRSAHRAGALRLAEAILARYGINHASQPDLAFIFQRAPIMQTIVQQWGGRRVHLAPRLALTWQVTGAVAERQSYARPLLTDGSLQPRAVSIPARLPTQHTMRLARRSAPLAELISHSSARSKRIALPPRRETFQALSPALDRGTPGTINADLQGSGEPHPLRQVVRRIAPPPDSSASIQEAATLSPAAVDGRHVPDRLPAQGEPRAETLSHGDLNRLADQVIQTIDRRIIAQRERLGRL